MFLGTVDKCRATKFCYGASRTQTLASTVGLSTATRYKTCSRTRNRYSSTGITNQIPILRLIEGVFAIAVFTVLSEAREADLDGRVIYIDLDTVICGSLNDVAGFSGGFAALSAASMENERRPTGINSSVMCWDSRDDRKVSALHELLAGAYNVVSTIASLASVIWC